jgi:molybdenum cofactor biosynthesis enzyme MoaA
MWFQVNVPSKMRVGEALNTDEVTTITDTAVCNQIRVSDDGTRLNCLCRINGGGVAAVCACRSSAA